MAFKAGLMPFGARPARVLAGRRCFTSSSLRSTPSQDVSGADHSSSGRQEWSSRGVLGLVAAAGVFGWGAANLQSEEMRNKLWGGKLLLDAQSGHGYANMFEMETVSTHDSLP
jgi:hypothetical protein